MRTKFKAIIQQIKASEGITQAALAEKLGLHKSYLSDMINERVPVTETVQASIYELFPYMKEFTPPQEKCAPAPLSSLPHQKVEITDKHGSTSQVDAVRVDEMEDYTRAKEIGVSLIPQYEEGFRGGNEGEKDEIKSVSTYWGLPNVAGQSMYPVRGDSMAPKYPANCKVVIKDFAFNPAEPFTIPFGETFAIAVNVNGALNYYVKRLFKHPDRDKQKTTYIARSYNPDYEDFEIPIQNIAYLGIVVARVSVDITCNY